MPLRTHAGEGRWQQIAELLLEQGLVGVGLIDLDGRILGVNDAIGRITGYERDELIGRHVLELTHADDRGTFGRALDRLVAGRLESYTGELRGYRKDGRSIWARIAVWPLRDETGAVDACLGVLEDQTAARRAIDRSRRIEARIREGLLAMADAREPQPVLQAVVDLAREVVGARYAALGIVTEGGRDLSEFLVSGVDRATIEAIGRWPTGKGLLGAVTGAREPIRLADLRAHPASEGFPPNHPPMRSFLGVPVVYKGQALGNLYLTDKVGAVEFTSEDESLLLAFAAQAAVVVENARMHERGRRLIERLDRTNRELERASAERTVFLASMSHELRTPLHALLLAADILRDPAFPVSEERARELSETIATSGRHLLGLIDDLLELSRIEAGHFDVRLEPTAVNLLLLECRQATVPVAARKRVRLEFPEVDGLWVKADALRARQAILNLLANAVKFTDAGGRVWVEVRPTEDAVTIAVCDTGTGIAADDLERIFLPFERIGEAHGVGLGLAISRAIAHVHGGTLEARSAPGEGSTFELTLPRSHRPVPSEADRSGSRPQPSRPARVLVVEDDARALDLTVEILDASGYAPSTASTVAQALASIRRFRPDVVLLDVRLGSDDGLDVARHLRADPTTRHVPVLAASASASDEDVARAKAAGCDAFLAKPVTPATLLAGIAGVLEGAARS
jgi:PAS domain S-box-containing protein